MELFKPELPEAINQFNVYSNGNRLLGVSGEVSLPSLTELTTTIDGPGFLGEIDTPNVGLFGGMEQEIPFRVLYYSAINLLATPGMKLLTLRGAIQTSSREGDVAFKPVRVVFGGRKKELSLGKFKQGESMDSSIKLELTYFLYELGGVKCIELDKLNGIYKVYGVDQLAAIKAMC